MFLRRLAWRACTAALIVFAEGKRKQLASRNIRQLHVKSGQTLMPFQSDVHASIGTKS